MDITSIVAQALALDSVKNATSLDFESLVKLSFEVAGLVKKAEASSKEQNVALLVEVLDAIILSLKTKDVASADPENATAVAAKYDSLKQVLHTAAPVLFLHIPHFDAPKSLSKAFSCCSGSCVAKQVDADAVAHSEVGVEAVKAVEVVVDTVPAVKAE